MLAGNAIEDRAQTDKHIATIQAQLWKNYKMREAAHAQENMKWKRLFNYNDIPEARLIEMGVRRGQYNPFLIDPFALSKSSMEKLEEIESNQRLLLTQMRRELEHKNNRLQKVQAKNISLLEQLDSSKREKLELQKQVDELSASLGEIGVEPMLLQYW